jgi:Protein of unknown function (DUF3179)
VHSRILDIDGKKTTLDFGHEGVLYRQSFIMYDKQTDTKWNHSTGLAMSGKLAGRELQILPSRVMRWKNWKRIYPKTRVLAREGRFDFMGTYLGGDDYGALGLSVGLGPRAKLYPFEALMRQEVVNDKVEPLDVVIVIEPNSKQAVAFSRKVDGKTLTFQPVGAAKSKMLLMRDEQTGTLWERLSGRAVKGKLNGREILPTISVPWLLERWKQIYKDGIVYHRGP